MPAGRRLIDYARFSGPGDAAPPCLVEAGQHWEAATVDAMLASVAALLRHLGLVARRSRRCRRRRSPPPARGSPR